MPNNIILKKSSTNDKVPLPGDLQFGELALNFADGNLFYKTSANAITTIASNKFVSVTGNVTGGNISTTGILDFTSGNANIGSVSTTAGWYYETNFSVAAQDSEPRGVFFKPDGTRMYVAGNTGNDIIQYDLGTAWNVSTATYSNAFVVSSQGTNPYDVHFNDDGTIMYVLDGSNDDIDQYTLSSAWDIGSASFASIQFSLSGQESGPTGFWFRPDGTQLFVTGTTGDDVNEYNLGTAWNVSTASFVRVSSSLGASAPEGLAFSSDGTKMWIVGSTFNRITQFDLATPWNVSTLSYNSQLPIYGSGPFAVAGASGLYVNESAGVAYVSDYQNDRIFQYDTNTPTGQFYGPQWTAQTDFNVGNNLSVNANVYAGGSAHRFIGTVTAISAISSPNHSTTSSSGTTSLITGTTTGTLNFATGITTGTLNQMTAQTTGVFTLGGTGATGAINIGRSTANQSISIGNGVTASDSVKTINIGTLGASGSNTNVTIGSATAGAVTTTTIYGNTNAGNLTTTGLISVAGNVTGGNFVGTLNGSGANVSSLNASNLTSGTVASARLSGTYTITVSGSATTAGTVTTAAQGNITSVGTLTSLAVSGAITVNSGGAVTAIVNGGTNGVGNIGSAATTFNTVFAKATTAQYADLAENYSADAEYEPGTVLIFGGTDEVTVSTKIADSRVVGVVTTNPAYLMNTGLTSDYPVSVALIGRVPVKVIGPVTKGDFMVSAPNGYAQACASPALGTVIGKAIQDFSGSTGVIEILINNQ